MSNLSNVFIMAQILDIFLNGILCILSYIVPKNKKQILLGSIGGAKFEGNPKYFYLFLLSKKTYFDRIFWITANKVIYAELSERKLPVLYLYSLKGFVSILRSNYLISTHLTKDVSYHFFLPGKFNKIQTWHGTPLKEILVFPQYEKKTLKTELGYYLEVKERESYKLALTACEEMKKIFDKFYNNVEILGYPRNDVFFNKSLVFEDYEKKLNLNQFEKIILYCPTFRDKGDIKIIFSDYFVVNFNNYLMQNKYLFLFKGHPIPSIRTNVNLGNNSNIIDVSEIVGDVQDLLIHTDVLITDYSSVFFDFMLSDKPVIFYPYDFDEYVERRKLYYDYFETLPGPFAKTENELFELIKTVESILNQKEYKEKYEKFKYRFNYYNDGGSCERLYNYLMKNRNTKNN